MNHNCWLPELEYYEGYSTWGDYETVLYSIFKKDFIESQPTFKEMPVHIRKHPIEHDKEEAFFHVTCQDYLKDNNRDPDFRRCERIRWVRAFIENYNCNSSLCSDCSGIKVWEEQCHGKNRVHILLEEERYMVVVEPRKTYCLLITAFYFDREHALKKKLKHYEQYRK